VATVFCVNCASPADDMDGMCPSCGKSIFEEVRQVFDNGPVPDKQGVSSAGRLDRSDYRTRSAPSRSASDGDWVAYADELLASSHPVHRPERGPVRPVNVKMPGPAEWDRYDDAIKAESRLQELEHQTYTDWEQAQWRADRSAQWLTDGNWHELGYDPGAAPPVRPGAGGHHSRAGVSPGVAGRAEPVITPR